MKILAHIMLACTVAAISTSESTGAEAWAYGVSRNAGWHDYNKAVVNDGYMADTAMCWAASSSNVIDWWQGHNASSLTSTTPQGKQIWTTFRSVFMNVGSNASHAYQWWMKGTGELSLDSEYNRLDDGGKAQYFDFDIIENKDKDYANELNLPTSLAELAQGGFHSSYNANYIIAWDSSNPYDYSNAIVNALNDGYALTLSVRNEGLAHAYTLWGVEYSETEKGYLLTKAWITDSDDQTYQLVEKKLMYSDKAEGGGIAFDENFGAKLSTVAGLKTEVITQSVPEPATTTLSLLALAGLAAHRRRASYHERK